MTAENERLDEIIALDLMGQIKRLERAYEDKVAENGCLEFRVAEMEVDVASKERYITGLEMELSALRMAP
jgi:hypothetical protein